MWRTLPIFELLGNSWQIGSAGEQSPDPFSQVIFMRLLSTLAVFTHVRPRMVDSGCLMLTGY